ncbi:bifunctional hydroxymethylpyrimidine kinase/phosphomethylpyrimidine kinase [Paenibacillus athensensis]|uniref:Hydroxymethylpyrimidine/phosphomethylpyrimidine kinase n=1 Tax=Paenibacillus athensensis TaxID=1967502 RepID=A0A4Y8PQ36_9BACL|nr:bifunctional hydroxymethylpyrimidine kinase/phosphomethylpyrimidine kinase [Paenibacillus athensensis]
MAVAKALTIAGSDSGGGAGLQADLKTFQELGVYGMSVVTAVTAQNTLGVHGVYPLSVDAVERQLWALGEDLPPDALKTGMLHDGDLIRVTAEAVRRYGWGRLVIDPVMLAKGGAALLRPEAVAALIGCLLPLAALVTPNLPEAEALSGLRITDDASRRSAALRIHAYGAACVVIKGGHDEGDAAQSTDLLYDGERFVTFTGPRLATRHTHGTGCTFAAAAAAGLARGQTVAEAVGLAKRFVQAALAEPLELGGGHGPTNHWAYRWQAAARSDGFGVDGGGAAGRNGAQAYGSAEADADASAWAGRVEAAAGTGAVRSAGVSASASAGAGAASAGMSRNVDERADADANPASAAGYSSREGLS